MEIDYIQYSKIFKVFSDPKRLKIIDMLSNGELCACKIQEEFHITQPTLSHDMKLLCDAGVVIARKEGKWMHYSIDLEGAVSAQMLLKQLLTLNETSDQTGGCCDK